MTVLWWEAEVCDTPVPCGEGHSGWVSSILCFSLALAVGLGSCACGIVVKQKGNGIWNKGIWCQVQAQAFRCVNLNQSSFCELISSSVKVIYVGGEVIIKIINERLYVKGLCKRQIYNLFKSIVFFF